MTYHVGLGQLFDQSGLEFILYKIRRLDELTLSIFNCLGVRFLLPTNF